MDIPKPSTKYTADYAKILTTRIQTAMSTQPSIVEANKLTRPTQFFKWFLYLHYFSNSRQIPLTQYLVYGYPFSGDRPKDLPEDVIVLHTNLDILSEELFAMTVDSHYLRRAASRGLYGRSAYEFFKSQCCRIDAPLLSELIASTFMVPSPHFNNKQELLDWCEQMYDTGDFLSNIGLSYSQLLGALLLAKFQSRSLELALTLKGLSTDYNEVLDQICDNPRLFVPGTLK